MRQIVTLLVAICTLAAGQALATPVWTDAAKATALINRTVSDAASARANVSQLATVLQLAPLNEKSSETTQPVFSNGQPGKLLSTDLQLAMTQLSIHIGSNNQIRVLRAQGDRRDALILQSGFMTLTDLAKSAETQGLDGIRVVDGVVNLTRPLIVWLGAGLKLTPGDRLVMDAASGAFLLGFGQLDMIGADISAAGMASTPESFRPFVLITGQGTLYAKETRFSGLGMVGADPFSGVVISQRGLFEPPFPPALIGNVFEDLGVVGMIGVNKGIIADNLIKSGRGGGISLVSVNGAVVSGNAVMGTLTGSGVKVADATSVHLTGNHVSGGAGNGISIGGNSKEIQITANAVLANSQTGIATQRATCVLVSDNSIARNGASGLRLNESGVSRVQGNALIQNANSGLQVGAQRKGGRVEVTDNLLVGNRVGLSGRTIGEVVLDQNNLTSQMPRLFDGEFSQYLAGYLTQVQQKSGQSYHISAPDGHEMDAFLTTCNKG